MSELPNEQICVRIYAYDAMMPKIFVQHFIVLPKIFDCNYLSLS